MSYDEQFAKALKLPIAPIGQGKCVQRVEHYLHTHQAIDKTVLSKVISSIASAFEASGLLKTATGCRVRSAPAVGGNLLSFELIHEST